MLRGRGFSMALRATEKNCALIWSKDRSKKESPSATGGAPGLALGMLRCAGFCGASSVRVAQKRAPTEADVPLL